MTHHIVFLDRETLEPEIELRKPAFPHTYQEYPATRPDQVVERARDATIVIVNKVPLPAETLEKLPNLGLVAVAATGTNPFDVAWCREHGVVVSNIQGYAVRTVPEHTFAMILALRRSLFGYRESLLDGVWQRKGQFCFFDHPRNDLYGSRLVVVGAGSVGRAVATIGRAFGMEVRFAARKEGGGEDRPDFLPWDEAIASADVLSLHCPLTPLTRDLIAAPELSRMKKSAILINAARGGVVNEADLESALRAGAIAGAGTDVTVTEPAASDSPMMKLLDLPNFVLTPHIAWASHEAQLALAEQLIDNIEAFAAGRPVNQA